MHSGVGSSLLFQSRKAVEKEVVVAQALGYQTSSLQHMLHEFDYENWMNSEWCSHSRPGALGMMQCDSKSRGPCNK